MRLSDTVRTVVCDHAMQVNQAFSEDLPPLISLASEISTAFASAAGDDLSDPTPQTWFDLDGWLLGELTGAPHVTHRLTQQLPPQLRLIATVCDLQCIGQR